jgi:penicillin-binding protein 1C
MAPRRAPPPFKAKQSLWTMLFSSIILILIAIGIRTRTIFSLIFSPLFSFIQVVKTFAAETAVATHHWWREKRVKKTPEKEPILPKKTHPGVLKQWVSETRVGAYKVAQWVSASRLPRITFIRIHIRVPKIHVPKRREKPQPPTQQFSNLQIITTKISAFILGVGLTVLFIFVPYNAWLFLKSLPNPQLLSQRSLEVSTKIFDRNGILLYEIYADQNRTPIPLSRIPQHVIDATIAIEDREFYYHLGFSVRGIVRALNQIIVHKQIQGGSTITQQLIKSALLSPEVSVVRKTKEILLAFWAERIYTKDQLLEMYFNQVPYGGTAWGIEAASQMYFHKSVSDLSLAEAALLAGLPAAPSEYSPYGSHPEKAYEREKEVLSSMVQTGAITKEEMNQALGERISIAKPTIAIRAPHFVMYVKELLEKKYGPRLVEQGGLRIITSLDAVLEDNVEYIVQNHIEALSALKVGNGAALVTNPKTGEILAMAGSRNYFDSTHDGNVNVTTALRQPGSSIKVVTYAAALENGMTAATLLDDSPIVYQQIGGPPYAPVNYDGRFHGLVPLRLALANSYNIPAVKTLAKIGIPVMFEKAKTMGITSWLDINNYGLSLTLGGGDVTMLDMAKVFGTLANGGKRVDLQPILEISDYTGRVIEKYTPGDGVPAVKPEVAWILSNILADNSARSAAFGPNSTLVIKDRTVSVKTGTSNDKRDNWTIGYTPSFVTTVWVGNNDNTPMDPNLASGITGAAPIWHDIMTEILKNRQEEVEPKPDTIISLPCYGGKNEYFIDGTQPISGRCIVLPTPTPTQ